MLGSGFCSLSYARLDPAVKRRGEDNTNVCRDKVAERDQYNNASAEQW